MKDFVYTNPLQKQVHLLSCTSKCVRQGLEGWRIYPIVTEICSKQRIEDLERRLCHVNRPTLNYLLVEDSKHKRYCRNYYVENKVEIQRYRNERVNCESCNVTHNRGNGTQHRRSKKHIHLSFLRERTEY